MSDMRGFMQRRAQSLYCALRAAMPKADCDKIYYQNLEALTGAKLVK
jgi:hypothetical protein